MEGTVLFADLTGSTSVFEAMGNERATKLVTKITDWISKVCQACGGRVVKTLGDGVLVVFPQPAQGVRAAIELQRHHHKRLTMWPPHARMELQIGVATGEIVEVEGDCFGDAVNVAARLSDLSGAEQIWATESTVRDLEPPPGTRFISLGNVPIRGKADTPIIYRVEWMEDTQTRHLTVPGNLAMIKPRAPAAATGAVLKLAWLDVRQEFDSSRMPVHIGRVDEAEFVVADQRVSRLHARIDWRGGHFTLTDLSSYGTWVRLGAGGTEVALRRNDCVLSGTGDIALGAGFDDFTAPTLSFEVAGPASQ
ncbi:adenylate/guanylate cyclase domain-containing protein [Ramlibacter albus]|uniref:FHA domain-containing protein n=1 Tax=Ramlibacter albus TaxID=2079448 RepID=A0A923M5L5_9BURK|nr:adenylate/guanylate cyclase domain-containing protein [Ramlibacter albus]MBC5764370.1 FHA domain-containing protein [Ramlibacter albus]